MFVLRSLFWLSSVVMLLPPSTDGQEPPPRVGVLQAAYATRVLLQDVTGVCARNPDACATSREALVLLSRKLETGASIVTSGIAMSQGDTGFFGSTADHGTLTTQDLTPEWSTANAGF